MLSGIGFSLQSQYDRPITEVISLLKTSGFSAVSPLWSPECDLARLTDCIRRNNMTIQSLHAPHKNIALLWESDTPQSAQVQAGIISCLDNCAQFEIPIMVVHGWQGLIYTFPDAPLDFRYFDQIVEYAGIKGISVAFENLEGEEYLAALMTRYRDQAHIGFCWDSGHDHCYPHKLDFLSCFGDRLIMTHLNDNLGLRDSSGIPSGDDDLHFLPYDGNLDWDQVIHRLKNAAKQTVLNFELKTRSHSKKPEDLLYANLSLEQFILKAGERAQKISELYK